MLPPTAPALRTHPAVLHRILEQAEAELYTHAQSARNHAQEVLAEEFQGPAGRLLHIRAGTLLAILDAQEGRQLQAIASALRLADEAVGLGADAAAARLHNVVGATFDSLDLTERSLDHFNESIRLARLSGDRSTEARAHTNLGVAWCRLGDDPQALREFAAALEIGLSLGRGDHLGRLHLDIAISQRRLGNTEAARESLMEARRCIIVSGHRRSLPNLEAQEALLAAESGEVATAIDTLGEAADIAHFEQMPAEESFARLQRARLLRTAPHPLRDLVAAQQEAQAALAAAERLDSMSERAEALEELADVCAALGQADAALVHLRAALALRQTTWERRHTAELATLRVQHEVAELRREREVLAAANHRLTVLNREKAEFLAIASHDLRSPLTLARILADRLLDADEPVDPVQVGGILRGSVTRMVSIIDRLLDSEALEGGRRLTSPGSFGLKGPLDSIVEAIRVQAAEKSITVELRCPLALTAWADPDAFDQVVYNLVDNAVKFTPPGRRVWVEALAQGDCVLVRVDDEGPGFRGDDLDRVFGKFARLSARPTGDETSHGLGLYVVNQLMGRMEGNAVAMNREGGGARFELRLPTPPITGNIA